MKLPIQFLSVWLLVFCGVVGGTGVPKDLASVVRAQIQLDESLFCPGTIDGQIGEFTYKALNLYNLYHGVKDLNDWGRLIADAEKAVRTPFAAYRIQESDFKHVNADLPTEPEEQVAFEYMAYRSIAEFVAERFHTDEGFLGRLNPGRRLSDLKAGDVVVVPNVTPFRIESIRKLGAHKEDAKLSARYVLVDTKARMATVYAGEKIVAGFPITPGKAEMIPVGYWKVTVMMNTAPFRYDKQMLEKGVRGQEAYEIPPGPNNPVGMLWAGLDKSGIGLHGTAEPRTIGRSRSAGCVRFANWDAVRLPRVIRPGATVEVR